MELLSIPLHRSLHRPDLTMGAETKGLMILGLITAIMIALHTWYSLLLGAILWIVILPILRMMAKSDVHMIEIYRLYTFRYRQFYPSHSTPFCYQTKSYK